MSVDRLQEKIRKTKNPSVFQIEALEQWLPPQYEACGFSAYFRALLEGLSDTVPAVRFGFGSFALRGEEGMALLSETMACAKELGYYVLMDLPELLTPAATENAVSLVKRFPCDGVIAGSYLGSDVLKPLQELGKAGRSVFAVCRTSNKSAVEIQDLLTGGRLVHTAAADIISRYAEPLVAKCGYSQLGALAAASSAQSLSTLRGKFNKMFLLLDGYDYPNANAKNCAGAFDRLGHGAAACASASIGMAWKEAETDGSDFVEQALQAALRMKKNLTRYITVL